jgi:hypothetical protein
MKKEFREQNRVLYLRAGGIPDIRRILSQAQPGGGRAGNMRQSKNQLLELRCLELWNI